MCRASQNGNLRKVEADGRSFRTEIERAEFLAVDWVDEYEAALFRKDLAGRTAVDYAARNGHTPVVEALRVAETR